MRRHPSRQSIKVAADAAIFTVLDGQLQALLIQMKKRPFTGRWAFPGGLLADDESSETAVCRILSEQTGMNRCYLKQLAAFDDLERDPLGRVVSLAYFALIPAAGLELTTTDKYADVRWWPVSRLPELAYDHKAVAGAALDRLRAELSRSNIAWSVLPPAFTLADLQRVYEAILGRKLDKRNFRKKLLGLGLVKTLGKKAGGAHRPAALYRFRSRRTDTAI